MKIEIKTWAYHTPCGDRALSVPFGERRTLVLLADGMGGYAYPDKASEVAIETVAKYLQLYPHESPEISIQQAFIEADREIYRVSSKLQTKIGTSLTLLLIDAEKVYFSNIGDVRLYHLSSSGQLRLLSDDHRKTIDGNSYLTESINGRGFRKEPLVQVQPLSSKDCFLLCTDGAYMKFSPSIFFSDEWKTLSMDTIDDDCSIVVVSGID